MKAREGAALVAEQESLLAECDNLVAKARRKATGPGQLSPLEHRREATAEAEAMIAAIKGGLDDDDRRDVLAEDLHRRGADPVLVKAVTQPEAEAPPARRWSAGQRWKMLPGQNGRTRRNTYAQSSCFRPSRSRRPTQTG